MRERTIPIDRGSIQARWWGPGSPAETVVLLHGGPGISDRYMEPVVPFLDDGRRRIVSFDQRGTGRSRYDSDDPADFGFDAQAADLTLVIDALAAGPVHVLGHSWGGILAMDYAGRHGDRLASIIVVGSAPPNHADVQIADASMTARIVELQERGLIPTDLPDDPTEGLRAVLPMYVWDPTFPLSAEALDALEVTPGIGELTWQAVGEFDLTESLRDYRGRALHIFGEADPIGLPAAEVTRAALSNSQLRYEVMERTGHFPWFEAPDRFRSILEDFLDG